MNKENEHSKEELLADIEKLIAYGREETQVPDFCLPNQDEEEICLRDIKGRWIVLYFYPKDNTPGRNFTSSLTQDSPCSRKRLETPNTELAGSLWVDM